MKKHNEEKHALEKAAIHIFVKIYNQNHETKYRLLYQQEKPDAVLQDSRHNKLGLEITHLFYDSEEAKLLLGRSEQDDHETKTLGDLINELNSLIRRKEDKKKSYSQDYPLALLIRNASPIFGMSDILGVKHIINNPRKVFTNTWLLSRDGLSEWLLKDLNHI